MTSTFDYDHVFAVHGAVGESLGTKHFLPNRIPHRIKEPSNKIEILQRFLHAVSKPGQPHSTKIKENRIHTKPSSSTDIWI